MKATTISGGTVHKVPADVRTMLASDSKITTNWNDLTPLARNEWLCWMISVKRPETRRQHIERARAELKAGKRRPCCWMGCVHRTDKAISPSIRYILKKQGK